MGFFSRIGNAISSVVSAVASVGRAVVNTAKNVVGWVADKATKVWAGVKYVWRAVKPILKPVLKVVVNLIPFPVVRTAAKFLIKTVEFLEKVVDHPVVKKIQKAVEWGLEKAKTLKGFVLSEVDRREAIERRELLEYAGNVLDEHGQDQNSIRIGQIINEYALLKSDIHEFFEEKVEFLDYDHYLRLRAAHKLADMIEKKLTSEDVQQVEITDDDIFVLQTGNALLDVNPIVSDQTLMRLDRIISEISGKKLLPFVFEEIMLSWVIRVRESEKEWALKNRELSKRKVELRRAETDLKYENFTEHDIEKLKSEVESLSIETDKLATKVNEDLTIIDAAEGYLQILEGNEEILNDEYRIQEAERVGEIIIGFEQHGQEFRQLDLEDRELVIDFANMYRIDREERISTIPTVSVEVM